MIESVELEREIRDLAESILVANDKLELVLADIGRTLKTINASLQDIRSELRDR